MQRAHFYPDAEQYHACIRRHRTYCEEISCDNRRMKHLPLSILLPRFMLLPLLLLAAAAFPGGARADEAPLPRYAPTR